MWEGVLEESGLERGSGGRGENRLEVEMLEWEGGRSGGLAGGKETEGMLARSVRRFGPVWKGGDA
jgi:hypothetical protein